MKGHKGSASARRAKDSAMAAMLKKKGVRRDTGRCPMCHRMVANGAHVLRGHC